MTTMTVVAAGGGSGGGGGDRHDCFSMFSDIAG